MPRDRTKPVSSPLDLADALPEEWEALVHSLSALASCPILAPTQIAQLPEAESATLAEKYAEMGGTLVRVLQRTLQLQRSFDGDIGPEIAPFGPADLVPSHASGTIQPFRLPLYRRVVEATQHAHSRLSALGSSSSTGREHALDGLGSGAPTARELADSINLEPTAGSSHHAADAAEQRAFRSAYMELLADGAGDELDALRREEPAMDDAALGTLIDALEFGADSLGPLQMKLFSATFSRGSWERRRRSTAAPAASTAAEQSLSDLGDTLPIPSARGKRASAAVKGLSKEQGQASKAKGSSKKQRTLA